MCLSSPPNMLHAPPFSFFFIWSPEQYLLSSTDHQAPQYVVPSTQWHRLILVLSMTILYLCVMVFVSGIVAYRSSR
jgi:hypothetical protein